MESNQQKFERTRAKFRRSFQRETKNKRRTIFLEDDEMPSSSKNRPSYNRRGTRRTAPTQAMPRPTSKKERKARHFRMTVTPATRPGNSWRKTEKTANPTTPPEPARVVHDTIYLSEDETPPPPPIWEDVYLSAAGSQAESFPEVSGEESSTGQKLPPSIETDEDLMLDDVELSDVNLDDCFVLEFCRSLWGMSDTTVNKRPPTPPSPMASSSSSLDWESKNFRPPTPPRRRGFVNFETQDRCYRYWGMQCYERVWRAQVMIPKVTPLSAVTNHPHQQLQESVPWRLWSSPPQPDHLNQIITVNPSGEWRNTQILVDPAPQPNPPPPIPLLIEQHNTSTIPSPPPLYDQTPPLVTISPRKYRNTMSDHPSLDQLPERIQEEINEVRKTQKGMRVRYKRDVWGHAYRITIQRSGEVTVTRI